MLVGHKISKVLNTSEAHKTLVLSEQSFVAHIQKVHSQYVSLHRMLESAQHTLYIAVECGSFQNPFLCLFPSRSKQCRAHIDKERFDLEIRQF